MASTSKKDELKTIEKLQIGEQKWTIQIAVLRRGAEEISLKGSKYMNLIFMDHEGTKITATIFGDAIRKYKHQLLKGQTYKVSDATVKQKLHNIESANLEKEIIFQNITEVVEIKLNEVSMSNILQNVATIEDVKTRESSSEYIDIIGIAIHIGGIRKSTKNGNTTSRSREIIIVDSKFQKVPVILWNDLAEHEGLQLEEEYNGKNPVIALLNVQPSIYEGTFQIKTTRISVVLIQPNVKKATELYTRFNAMTPTQKDEIIYAPSKEISLANRIPLHEIGTRSYEGKVAIQGKIKAILNKDQQWRHACKKCSKTKLIEDKIETTYCETCKEQTPFVPRFYLRLKVTDGNKEVDITLFDQASNLLKCDVKTYINSITESNDKYKSRFYKRLVQSQGKEYVFLISSKDASTKTNYFIAQDIQEAELINNTTQTNVPVTTRDKTKGKRINQQEAERKTVAINSDDDIPIKYLKRNKPK